MIGHCIQIGGCSVIASSTQYVPKELLPVYKDHVIPLADIITPNQFEAEYVYMYVCVSVCLFVCLFVCCVLCNVWCLPLLFYCS